MDWKWCKFLLFLLIIAQVRSLLDYDANNTSQLFPLLQMEYFCDNFLISRLILENQSLNSLAKYLKHAIDIIKNELQQNCEIFQGTLKEEMAYCPERTLYTSCLEAAHLGNGVYRFNVTSQSPMDSYLAYCLADNEDGDPWTVIQRRTENDISFERNFDEYENGFGNPYGSYWLGLRRIHALMLNGWQHELWIQLENFENETRFVKFDDFAIGDQSRQYALINLGAMTGTAGNSLTGAIGAKYATIDRGSDEDNGQPCATTSGSGGGWWFGVDSCGDSNLNGHYIVNGEVDVDASGIFWKSWSNDRSSFKYVHMAIRRKR